jgi:peroxiredoxin
MSQPAIKGQKQAVSLGWRAADFRLEGTDGKSYSINDVRGPKGLLVIFMCNHCPYVKGALDRIIRDTTELKALGIGSVAIMSNDTVNYPDDSFENMKKLAKDKKLPFPYLFDEKQDVAHAYDAACTPEFYGFDAGLQLAYRGRIDAGGMKNPPAGSPRELYEAMKLIAETGKGPKNQQPGIGCSIKWKSA